MSQTAESTSQPASPAPAEYGRKNPFPSLLKRKVLLSKEGSAKETWHFEFDLAGSGLSYEPGDSMAVVPENPDDVIDDLLQVTGFSGETVVDLKAHGDVPLREAFRKHVDITGLTTVFLGKYQKVAEHPGLGRLLEPENRSELNDWLWGRQLVDLLEAFPWKGMDAQGLVSLLRRILPRLYSVASSQKAHADEVHLTVETVRYVSHGRNRKGIATTWLADEIQEGDKIPVYTHVTKGFRLPEDGSTPVIMIGPGTGIAPFRGFMQERAALGQDGKSWLFFGDQHVATDFLYEDEWKSYMESGVLHKLSTAFSRDQEHKIYVQHRMLEEAAEIWKWMEEGAHFYVCGDANRMAKDVNEALIRIAIEVGGLADEEAASALLDEWRKAKRYQRDVY